MEHRSLQRILLLFGWATLFGYCVEKFASLQIRLSYAKSVSTELMQTTAFSTVIGALLESPLHLPIGLLCLFAAAYLKNKPKPISEVFE